MKFAFISKGSDGVTSKNGTTSVAPKKESNLISVFESVASPIRSAFLGGI